MEKQKMKDRIKTIRKHFGFTQEQFSKRINRTAGYIGKVETGRCNASDVYVLPLELGKNG